MSLFICKLQRKSISRKYTKMIMAATSVGFYFFFSFYELLRFFYNEYNYFHIIITYIIIHYTHHSSIIYKNVITFRRFLS